MFNRPRVERPSGHEVSCQCALCKEYWGQTVTEHGSGKHDKKHAHTWQTSKGKGQVTDDPTMPRVTSTTTNTWKTCVHDGSKAVHTLSTGTTLYGARAATVMDHGAKVAHIEMILDCSGNVKPRKFVTAGGRRIMNLNRFAFPDVVSLFWPDMSAPTYVGLSFWQGLLAILPKTVCITCIGSHGRTGTALACLMVADGMDPQVAIDTVRSKHCRNAIETAGQEAYIKSLGNQQKGRA